MKHLARKFLFLIIAAIAVPVFVFAQQTTQQQVTPGATSSTATAFNADFTFSGIPTQKITFYAWIREDGGANWISTDMLLTSVGPSNQQVTANFSVSFNGVNLGLQNGKKYLYYIHGVHTNGYEQDYTNPACFTFGIGAVACTTSPGTPPNTQPIVLGPSSITLISDVVEWGTTAGTYKKLFSIIPKSQLPGPVETTLKLFMVDANGNTTTTVIAEKTGTLPGTITLTNTKIENLAAGNYAAAVFQGSTQVSDMVTFTVAPPTPAPSSGSGSNPVIVPNNGSANYGGGLTISFPPQIQNIGNTSAEIHGEVSVSLPMPVELSVLFGAQGTPLGNEQLLLSVPAVPPLTGMAPGTIKPVTVNFTGLTPGQTYLFAIKNKITNQIGAPFQFTTTGGANPGGVITYTGGLFPYTPSPYAGTGSASVTPQFTDTISDQGIVPKCGRIAGEGVDPNETRMCNFDDFMTLIANVIQFGLVMLGIIVAIIVMYSGVQLILLGRVSDKTALQSEEFRAAKARFFKVGIGLCVIVFAWVMVKTVFVELGVKPEYTFLDIVS